MGFRGGLREGRRRVQMMRVLGEGGSGGIVEVGDEGVEESGAGDEDVYSCGEMGEGEIEEGGERRPGCDIGGVVETLWGCGGTGG